ncbi:hypothetical protein V8F06_007248 [Rhypophila decipiens]
MCPCKSSSRRTFESQVFLFCLAGSFTAKVRYITTYGKGPWSWVAFGHVIGWWTLPLLPLNFGLFITFGLPTRGPAGIERTGGRKWQKLQGRMWPSCTKRKCGRYLSK